MIRKSFAVAALVFGIPLTPAHAQGSLNLSCSVQVEWCQAVATNFQKATGINVAMTQRGSGEVLTLVERCQRPSQGSKTYSSVQLEILTFRVTGD